MILEGKEGLSRTQKMGSGKDDGMGWDGMIDPVHSLRHGRHARLCIDSKFSGTAMTSLHRSPLLLGADGLHCDG